MALVSQEQPSVNEMIQMIIIVPLPALPLLVNISESGAPCALYSTTASR